MTCRIPGNVFTSLLPPESVRGIKLLTDRERALFRFAFIGSTIFSSLSPFFCLFFHFLLSFFNFLVETAIY